MAYLTDPVVLICAAIVLVGLGSLVWAVSRLFPKRVVPGGLDAIGGSDATYAPPPVDETDFRDPLLSRQEITRPSPPVSPGPAVNREVSDRLETMTQRLAEMQTLLSKQAAAPSGVAAGPGGVGQGFSPETIDKLLKIIGNVVQQVDILQKALNVPKDGVKPGA